MGSSFRQNMQPSVQYPFRCSLCMQYRQVADFSLSDLL